MINKPVMSKEAFEGYLTEVEQFYGKEMRMKMEALHQKGHIGEDICLALIGQSPAHPIILNRLDAQVEQVESKRRM